MWRLLMAKRRGNWYENYPKVMKYLEKRGLEYVEYSDGQHLKIFGEVAAIDLWPSRMVYHVIESELPATDKYPSLGFNYREKELDILLNG